MGLRPLTERIDDWLAGAEVGDVILYMQADHAGRRPAVRDKMRALAESGEIALFQNRVRPGVYDYLAKRVSKRVGKILKPWEGEI